MEKSRFERILDDIKEEKGIKFDNELSAGDLKDIIQKFKEFYKEEKGEDFPQDPKVQLLAAIEAVFRSWDNPRAIVYRRMNDIPSNWGTAVNVQAMVFGNMGDTSGTGVAFTQQQVPPTAKTSFTDEYLYEARSGVPAIVVAGIADALPDFSFAKQNIDIYILSLPKIAPTFENQFPANAGMNYNRDGRLSLFYRHCKRAQPHAKAASKNASIMVSVGQAHRKGSVMMIRIQTVDALLYPLFDVRNLKKQTSIAKGLRGSPGGLCGKVVFTAQRAVEMFKGRRKGCLCA